MTSSATSSPTPAPPSRPSRTIRRGGDLDRRTIVVSALLLFGALVVGIVLIAVFSDPGTTPGPTTTDAGTPHIIDRPNSGTAPARPGDRGGSAQLLLLAGMVAVLGAIAYAALRGGSKARANRERWKAAAATGRDGALDDALPTGAPPTDAPVDAP